MRPEYKEIDLVDLLKIKDALQECVKHFRLRDEMNSTIHLAKEVRYSPITTGAEAALVRLEGYLK